NGDRASHALHAGAAEAALAGAAVASDPLKEGVRLAGADADRDSVHALADPQETGVGGAAGDLIGAGRARVAQVGHWPGIHAAGIFPRVRAGIESRVQASI